MRNKKLIHVEHLSQYLALLVFITWTSIDFFAYLGIVLDNCIETLKGIYRLILRREGKETQYNIT